MQYRRVIPEICLANYRIVASAQVTPEFDQLHDCLLRQRIHKFEEMAASIRKGAIFLRIWDQTIISHWWRSFSIITLKIFSYFQWVWRYFRSAHLHQRSPHDIAIDLRDMLHTIHG